MNTDHNEVCRNGCLGRYAYEVEINDKYGNVIYLCSHCAKLPMFKDCKKKHIASTGPYDKVTDEEI
jgi:hypothetical protein